VVGILKYFYMYMYTYIMIWIVLDNQSPVLSEKKDTFLVCKRSPSLLFSGQLAIFPQK
jgi:hypothetical protein